MKVYDFDQTIYKNDSSVDFITYCIKKNPRLMWRLPKMGWAFLKYLLGFMDKDDAKEVAFATVSYFPNIEQVVKEFWSSHKSGILEYYLNQCESTDVVISASPEFLLKGICSDLGVHTLIASKTDPRTGRWLAPNCYGEQKVVRFRELFGDTTVEEFYSDSLSDSPMAEIAQKAFVVYGNQLTPWEQYKPRRKSFGKMLLDPQFIKFAFCGGVGTLVNLIVSTISNQVIDPVSAYVVGYGVSLLATYIANAALVFKKKPGFLGFLKFVLSYLPNFLILYTFVWAFVGLRVPTFLVYCMAAALALPITFIIVKLFAFKGENYE